MSIIELWQNERTLKSSIRRLIVGKKSVDSCMIKQKCEWTRSIHLNQSSVNGSDKSTWFLCLNWIAKSKCTWWCTRCFQIHHSYIQTKYQEFERQFIIYIIDYRQKDTKQGKSLFITRTKLFILQTIQSTQYPNQSTNYSSLLAWPSIKSLLELFHKCRR